ncbi:MAG: hypothetical protein JXQ29_15285 [Planctomycetes bacterium]|nr:hypothetical protein [Planctomycetota bacterium]
MNRLTLFAIFWLTSALFIGSAATQSTGMVADLFGQVCIFDADSDTVIAGIPIPKGTLDTFLCDCAITRDRKLGFVSDFNNNCIWVIDLAQNPPTLAAATNPIQLTISPEDLSFSPDEKFLVVSGVWFETGVPVAVVDIANRTQIGTFGLGKNTSACAVEVCPDGSVLIAERTTRSTTQIRRLHIDGLGNLTDTNELIADTEAPAVFNLLHVRSDEEGNGQETYGIFVSLRQTRVIGSFRVQGMKMLSTATIANLWPFDAAVSPRGNRLFVRENAQLGGPGAGSAILEVFQFHRDAGCIGKPKSTILLDQLAAGLWGVEQVALHPSGRKLYVSGLGLLPEVRVFDANKGDLLATIKTPVIGEQTCLTGITIVGPETED